MCRALLAGAFGLSCASPRPTQRAPEPPQGDQAGLGRGPDPAAPAYYVDAGTPTYYVNGASGSDTAPGTSPALAFKTIGRAAAIAKPGDLVSVGPGVYTETVVIDGFAGAAGRTAFHADPVGGAVLQGEPAGDGTRKQAKNRFLVRRPNVTLDGFVVRDTSQGAISYLDAPGGLVERSTVTDVKANGVEFAGSGGRVIDSVVVGAQVGVYFVRPSGGAVIGCTLVRNGTAIKVRKSTGVVIFDNLLSDNGTGITIEVSGGDTVRSDHNLFHSGILGVWTSPEGANVGSLEEWQALTGQDLHSLRGDPMLIHAKTGDFTPGAPPTSTWSSAARAGLRVAQFSGETAPETDMLGRRPGAGITAAVGALFVPAAEPGNPLATIDMPLDGRLTAAVFDASGQSVRELLHDYPAGKGKQEVYWDGTDDNAKKLPPGRYSWRAIAHQVHGVDDGSVGNSGTPPYGGTHVPMGTNGLAADPVGNWYTFTFWDEAGEEIAKYDADGKLVWTPLYYLRNSHAFAIAAAADNKYLFVGLANVVRQEGKHSFFSTQVRRLDAATGAPANFPLPAKGTPAPAENDRNVIDVAPVQSEPWDSVTNYTPEARRKRFTICGMACDDKQVWITDCSGSRVESFDKETGARLVSFRVEEPRGVGVAPSGNLWVARRGDRVSEYTRAGTATGREITGLADPTFATFGGPSHHLYISESGPGHVLEYDVSGRSPARLRSFGRRVDGPGPVSPDTFRGALGGLAVDTQGRVIVDDSGTARILRYSPDFELLETRTSDSTMRPFVDEREPDVLISDHREYQVDYESGRWALTHDWQPGGGIRRTLSNGRAYLFQLGTTRAMGVLIWAVEGDGAGTRLRESAMVGARWIRSEARCSGPRDVRVHMAGYEWRWPDAGQRGHLGEEARR